MRPLELTGQRFGRLLVVACAPPTRSPCGTLSVRWLCRCDCGRSLVAARCDLRSGATTSCGCFRREKARTDNTTHGEGKRSARSPEYNCWTHMVARCEEGPRHKDWHLYGGRGIEVCARWRASYVAFLADMGRKPSSLHSIDRIDVNGHYEPGNCRWATPSEQRRNQRQQPAHP